AASLSIGSGSSQLRQNRQNESRCLSRACLGDADKIMSGENVRDRGDLNRSRLGVACFLDRLENLRGKIKSAKWHKPGTIVSSGASASLILGSAVPSLEGRPLWRPKILIPRHP